MATRPSRSAGAIASRNWWQRRCSARISRRWMISTPPSAAPAASARRAYRNPPRDKLGEDSRKFRRAASSPRLADRLHLLAFGRDRDADGFTRAAREIGEDRVDQIRHQILQVLAARLGLCLAFEQALVVGDAVDLQVELAGIDGVAAHIVVPAGAEDERIIEAEAKGAAAVEAAPRTTPGAETGAPAAAKAAGHDLLAAIVDIIGKAHDHVGARRIAGGDIAQLAHLARHQPGILREFQPALQARIGCGDDKALALGSGQSLEAGDIGLGRSGAGRKRKGKGGHRKQRCTTGKTAANSHFFSPWRTRATLRRPTLDIGL